MSEPIKRLAESEFGSAKITQTGLEIIENFKDEHPEMSWSDIGRAIFNGEMPRLKDGQFDDDDIFEAGLADGCPVTAFLLTERAEDPNYRTTLINAYMIRDGAHRNISEILKKTGNTELLEKWEGNDPRAPEEKRVNYALAATPKDVIEKGNPHVGTAKYENFAICQLFRRLKDAEDGVEGPIKDVPKNIKFYPNMLEFSDDIRDSKSLNELDIRIVERLIPELIIKNFTPKQISDLLSNCFLAEALLLEDNCWNRATKLSNQLADKLSASDILEVAEVGQIFKENIQPMIYALKND